MSARDDIAIARRFEPTSDGCFLHREGRKAYKLTTAQAGLLARILEREQTWSLLFSLAMPFFVLDVFFDFFGPLWPYAGGVLVLTILSTSTLGVVDLVRHARLLRGCPRSEVEEAGAPAKTWRQRLASLQGSPAIRRLGTRNLVLQSLASLEWIALSAFVLWTSPSWLPKSRDWLDAADASWFAQGVLHTFGALLLVGLLFAIVFFPFVIAACLRTLHERSQGTELEGTNGA